jgi:flagellar assembly protein FliH
MMQTEIRRLEYRSLKKNAGTGGTLPPAVFSFAGGPSAGGAAEDSVAPGFGAQAKQIMLLESKLAELKRTLEDGEVAHAAELLAAREEALQSADASYAAKLKGLRQQMEDSLQEMYQAFVAERNTYFARAESELVKLALAVAARILNREANMDALLLRGAVRVALGQLQEKTVATLKVPESDLTAWQAWQMKMENGPSPITVIADDKLETGGCRIELETGSVDLGVQAQLAEIERGFFDLLAQRPATANEVKVG